MFKIYEKILMEGKFDVLSKKYPSLNIEEIFFFDPSPTKKYSEWMCKQFIAGFKENDVYPTIEAFHRIGQNLEKKDINQYKDLKELEDTIKDRSFSKTQKRKIIKSEGTKKIYEDETSIVLRIDTKEACVFYGSNTRWCITMTDHQYYENYVSDNTLFYFILSKIKRDDKQNKVAVSVNRDKDNKIRKFDFFDEEDFPLGIRDVLIPNFKTDIATAIKNDIKTAPKHFLSKLSNEEFSIEEYRNYIYDLEQNGKLKEILNTKIIAASNPNCSEEILKELCEDRDIHIRQTVAANKNLSIELIYKLYNENKNNEDILCSLADNSKTPLELLKAIFKISHNDIYTNFISTNLSSNPNIDEEIFYELFENNQRDSGIMNNLVSNPNIPEKLITLIIEKYINLKETKSYYGLIFNAFSNPSIPLEFLEKYSESYIDSINLNLEIKIHNAILRNIKTPISILKKLLSSDSEDVRIAASNIIHNRMQSQKENKSYSLKDILLEKRDIISDTETVMMSYKTILRKKRFLCKVSFTEPDFSVKHGDFGFLEVLIDLKSGRGKNMTKYSILKYSQRLAEKVELLKYFNYSGYSLNGQYLEIQFELKQKYINVYLDKYKENQTEESEETSKDAWYLPKNK